MVVDQQIVYQINLKMYVIYNKGTSQTIYVSVRS